MTVGRPRTSPRRRVPSPRRGRLGTQGGRAAFLGTGPTAWYDTRDLLTTTQQTLTNRVGVSTVQLGSTAGSDTNDPLALIHSGTNYVYLPGTTENALYSGVTATPTGNFTVIVKAASTDWSAGATQGLASQYESGANKRAWSLYVGATGTVALNISADGSANSTAATAATIEGAGYTNGQTLWIKAVYTFSVGGFTCPVSISTDGTTYTAFETISVPAFTSTQCFQTSTALTVGARFHTAPTSVFSETFRGNVFEVSFHSGTYLMRSSEAGQASWTSGTGETWNVIRSTTGLSTSIVTRPLAAFDGTDDYLQLPAGDIPTFTATTGTHTALVVARNRSLAASGTLWSSESASNVGGNLFLTSAGVVTARVGGATTTADATVGTGHDDDVTLNAFALVYNNGTVRAYRYGAAISATADTTGVGTVTHASAPRIGSRADSAAVLDRAEIVAAVHYTRALTQAELDTASAFLTGNYT